MKANEAPEKIYVYIPDDDIVGTASTQKGFPHQFVTEEYTRTDAFIEKACKFIDERLIFEDKAWYTDGEVTLKDEVIEEFKNYMKGNKV